MSGFRGTKSTKFLWALPCLLSAIVCYVPERIFAEISAVESPVYNTEKLNLVAGKSQVIETSVPITRASIADPNVADTVVLSPKQLYVVGKKVGATNLTLWDEKGRVLTIYNMEITPDLDRLKLQLQHLLPDEQKIQIESSHDFVTLSGKVRSSSSLKEVLAIAEAYAPSKIINLLEVDSEISPPVQVDVIKGISVNKVEF